MSLLDQSGVTGGGFDPCNVHAFKHGQHVDGKIWKLRLSCSQGISFDLYLPVGLSQVVPYQEVANQQHAVG